MRKRATLERRWNAQRLVWWGIELRLDTVELRGARPQRARLGERLARFGQTAGIRGDIGAKREPFRLPPAYPSFEALPLAGGGVRHHPCRGCKMRTRPPP